MTDKPAMRLQNGDVIHEGGYGVTRDGRKVGPLRLLTHNRKYPWADDNGYTYNDSGQFAIDLRVHVQDIIAAYVEPTALPPIGSVGTLAELRVKEGDVVEFLACNGERLRREIACVGGELWATDIGGVTQKVRSSTSPKWRLIARASQPAASPVRWGDMTPEQKGALLLAAHEGNVIEVKIGDLPWRDTDGDPIGCHDENAYRVKPAPSREIATLFWKRGETGSHHEIGTVSLEDGKPATAYISTPRGIVGVAVGEDETPLGALDVI